MSFRVHRTEKIRHLILRTSGEEILPSGLLEVLRREGVACGWLRATGVLADVSLRAYGAEAGAPKSRSDARLIAGPVQALTLDGVVSMVEGAPSCSLRAVLARETDRGLETFGGEIVSARAVALEVLVTAFDEIDLGGTLARRTQARATDPSPTAPGWSGALEASVDTDRVPTPAVRVQSAVFGQSSPMPTRPVARPGVEVDAPVPEVGDEVEHFAFGRCDVIKSEGDRLHLRIHKDGRIREIALEMLRVVRLPEEDGKPGRFKLERRI